MRSLTLDVSPMAQIPVLVVHDFEVRQREFLLKQFRQLLLTGLGPFANEDQELVNGPNHTAMEITLHTQIALPLRIIDERIPFFLAEDTLETRINL